MQRTPWACREPLRGDGSENAGGVMPPLVPAPAAGSLPFRLTFAEREEIACRRAAGHGVRVIARALGRPPSTVSRELCRGTVRRKSGYRATVAQAAADARARRPKVAVHRDGRPRHPPQPRIRQLLHRGLRQGRRRVPGAQLMSPVRSRASSAVTPMAAQAPGTRGTRACPTARADGGPRSRMRTNTRGVAQCGPGALHRPEPDGLGARSCVRRIGRQRADGR